MATPMDISPVSKAALDPNEPEVFKLGFAADRDEGPRHLSNQGISTNNMAFTSNVAMMPPADSQRRGRPTALQISGSFSESQGFYQTGRGSFSSSAPSQASPFNSSRLSFNEPNGLVSYPNKAETSFAVAVPVPSAVSAPTVSTIPVAWASSGQPIGHGSKSTSFTSAASSIASSLTLGPDSQVKTLARLLAAGSNGSSDSAMFIQDTLRKMCDIAVHARLASSTITFIHKSMSIAKKRAPFVWSTPEVKSQMKRFKDHLKLNHAALMKPRLQNDAVLSPRTGGGRRLRTASFELGMAVALSPSSRPPRRKVLVKGKKPQMLLNNRTTSPTRFDFEKVGKGSKLNSVPQDTSGKIAMPTMDGRNFAGGGFGTNRSSLSAATMVQKPTNDAPRGPIGKISLNLPKCHPSASRSKTTPKAGNAIDIGNPEKSLSLNLNRIPTFQMGNSKTVGGFASTVGKAGTYTNFNKTPDTKARSPTKSAGGIRPLSLSKTSTWHTVVTPPRGILNLPKALRPSYISPQQAMLSKRVAQAAAARAISLSPRSAAQSMQQSAMSEKMLQLQMDRKTLSPIQTPPKSLRAELRSPGRHGQLSDHYELGATLGRGSFSRVVLARHRSTGSSFACKIVMTDPLSRAEVRALQSEIDILHDLAHPNICNLVEVFAENEYRVSLVFELCAGGELFDAIVERDHFSEEDSRDVMHSLLSGVAYLHANFIAHRDLKPENILISRSNGDLRYLKIADFGFATKIDPERPHSLTRIVGTPGYMSPEILTPGSGYGLEVDVWALGVICYILLSGYAPFEHDDDHSLRDMIRAGDYRFEDSEETDSRVWSTVGPAAKHLISCMLVVDRSERYDIYSTLQHPWISGSSLAELSQLSGLKNTSKSSLVNSSAREKLRRFQVKKRWRARMNVIRAVGRMSAMRRAARDVGNDADDAEMILDDII